MVSLSFFVLLFFLLNNYMKRSRPLFRFVFLQSFYSLRLIGLDQSGACGLVVVYLVYVVSEIKIFFALMCRLVLYLSFYLGSYLTQNGFCVFGVTALYIVAIHVYNSYRLIYVVVTFLLIHALLHSCGLLFQWLGLLFLLIMLRVFLG